MLRRIVLFGFLALAMIGMVPAAPAQAQACQSDACLYIVLKEQCMSGSAYPPARANGFFLAEVIRTSPYAIVWSPDVNGGGLEAPNKRVYTAFVNGAQRNTEYGARWTKTQGWDAHLWSYFVYKTTPAVLGTTTTWSFYWFNYNC